MKLTKKHIGVAGLSALCAVSAAMGVSLLSRNANVFGSAETEEVSANQYFYENLTYTDVNGKEQEFVFAKKFYRAIDEMNGKGDFKDGVVDYSLTDNNLATSDMIKAWVENGDVTIPTAFSAARDAYYMDHPELFYIDIYKLTISAASVGETYTAYIDSGREDNLYAVGEFTSGAQVETALEAYNEKIEVIANYAKSEADKDQYGTSKKVLQAKYASQYIAQNTKYDDISAANSAITTASAAQTAYGALVKGKAVCNGYSRAFKAVMDKLEIPCIVVGGYSIAKNSEGETTTNSQGELTSIGEGHAWNYVWFENPVTDENSGISAQAAENGAWYGYDVTWNSTKKVNTYTNMTKSSMLKEHLPDGEISTSGYIVTYPELARNNYGSKVNADGLAYSLVYENVLDDNGNVEKDDFNNNLVEVWETVSFNEKGAVRLYEEDGLHLVYRRAYMGAEGEEWTPWTDIYTEIKKGAFGELAYGDSVAYKDSGNQVTMYSNSSVLYSQFAVINGLEPDLMLFPFDEKCIAGYSYENNPEDYMIDVSDWLTNESYLTYIPAPHVVESTPNYKEINMISQSMAASGSTQMDEKYAFDVYVRYNEPLEIIDDTKPIVPSFTSNYQYGPRANVVDYARFVPIGEDTDGEKIYAEIVSGKVEKDEKGKDVFVESKDGVLNTLHFRFCPSLMYEHNGMHYYFSFANVGSAVVYYKADHTPYTSHKEPNVLPLRFFREYIACNKCLPNGRMLLDCVAQPTLISNTDLSEVNFQDEDGKYFSAGQRSQMMLVVNKPTEADNEKMNELLEENNIDVSQEELKDAETYEIDLQICGRYTYIPNGSYVKIALGFPEGYSYNSADEGVTFKIYHYKRSADRKQIIGVEEIPCVVTKFGIVATVSSFSPFMIVPVSSEKAKTKNIYATVDGNGGKLNNADGQIQTLKKEGDNYTYTIAPDDGYQIYKVSLNGKNVTDKISEGKLTLTYDELDTNNELEIMFIANAAAERFTAKGVVDTEKVIVPVGGNTYSDPYVDESADNTGDNTGGNTGDSTGGNTGDSTGGNTPGGNTPGGDTPSGNTPGGNTGDGSGDSTGGDGSGEAGVTPGIDGGLESGKPAKEDHTLAIAILAVVAVVVVVAAVLAIVIIKKRQRRAYADYDDDDDDDYDE